MIDQRLRDGVAELKLDLPEDRLALLTRYLQLLEKWNRVYNLTAIRDENKWVTHHLLDSLAVVAHLPAGDVIDVGSGAGFPGIPIAAACLDRGVVLLDSNHKKSAFLQQAVGELKLGNARVEVSRAEAFNPRTRFGVVISRAFAELADFVRSAKHLCAESGRMIAMKGIFPHEEIAQLPAQAIDKVVRLVVPLLGAERHLVFVHPAQAPTQ